MEANSLKQRCLALLYKNARFELATSETVEPFKISLRFRFKAFQKFGFGFSCTKL